MTQSPQKTTREWFGWTGRSPAEDDEGVVWLDREEWEGRVGLFSVCDVRALVPGIALAEGPAISGIRLAATPLSNGPESPDRPPICPQSLAPDVGWSW